MIEQAEIPIQDDTENEEVSFKYSITSYGADFDVEGLIRRIRNGDIVVPPFQRQFVWTPKQKSRFIESLLLGLPVPGIFLSRETGTQKLLVIDGQQRLRSLQSFYGDPLKNEPGFQLKTLETRFNGLTYETLSSEDRRQLDNSIIHATVIRQDEPDDGDTSVYLIFQRLNTGGTQLQPQEIRAALYHGQFNALLSKLNENAAWRMLYGAVSNRRKDEELILRFLALYFASDTYEKPITEFLNVFMNKNKNLELYSQAKIESVFYPAVEMINQHIGASAYKPKRVLNIAIFDSVTVGVARRLAKGPIQDTEELEPAYQRLLDNDVYQAVINTGTSDEGSVERRLALATEAFAQIL